MDFSFTEDRRISVAPRTPKRRRKNFSDRGGGAMSPGGQSTTQFDKFDILLMAHLLDHMVTEYQLLQQQINDNKELIFQYEHHEADTQENRNRIEVWKRQIRENETKIPNLLNLSNILQNIIYRPFERLFLLSNPNVNDNIRRINRTRQQQILDNEVETALEERRHVEYVRLLHDNGIFLFSEDFVKFLKSFISSLNSTRKFEEFLLNYQNFTIAESAERVKRKFIQLYNEGADFANQNVLIQIFTYMPSAVSRKILTALNNELELDTDSQEYRNIFIAINRKITEDMIIPEIFQIINYPDPDNQNENENEVVEASDDELEADEVIEASDNEVVEASDEEVVEASDEEVVGSVDFGNYYDFDYYPESDNDYY